jgi:outer membrane protein OmpA-like peptidoglycan-associated protein
VDIRANAVSKSTDITAHVKGNAPMNVGIGGYADARGTDQHNQGLSERRVNAIRDALVKAGVASDKIQTSAFGEQNRSATNPLTLAGSAIVASTWDSAPAIK